jgi:Kef-type K+ transport system membrane component KefB
MKRSKRLLDIQNFDREPIYKMAALLIGFTFLLLVINVFQKGLSGGVGADKHVYLEIVFLVLLAVLAEVAVFYLKQQSAVTLMLLGILISPSFLTILWGALGSVGIPVEGAPLKIFEHEDVIHTFAQLGAIILLFKVGMHSKIEKIFSGTNMFVAVMGVILPFALGYFYASYTGGSFAYAMFVGAALAATSVGVTVAILKELKVLDKKFSEVIIGAAIIDDILALLVLSIVINMTGVPEQNASIVLTFITSAVFIIGAILTGKYFIRYMDRNDMSNKRFLLAIAYMLAMAYVAEVIQLSAIVGAFLAGVVLSKSRHYEYLEKSTLGLELIFMPIFFISLGLLVDIVSVAAYIGPILIITLIAFVSKIASSIFVGIVDKSFSVSDSAIVGIGMVPRGEVALIIASIGLANGILTQSEFSVISAMALLSAFIAPMVLAYFIKIFGTAST